jgi:serine/arginine repetitive matrix protein 1
MKGGQQFRGSTHEQDMKFSDKQKKLKSQLAFPPKFDKKIAKMSVRLPVLQPWINRRVTELLEMTDEVVMEYSYSLLEAQGDMLDAKELQIALQGFLLGHAQTFVSELWDLLLDASQQPDGIPAAIRLEDEINRAVRQAKPDLSRNERTIDPARRPTAGGFVPASTQHHQDRRRRSRSRSRSRSRDRKRRSRSRSRERRRRSSSKSRSRSRSREVKKEKKDDAKKDDKKDDKKDKKKKEKKS